MSGTILPTDADSYLTPHPDGETNTTPLIDADPYFTLRPDNKTKVLPALKASGSVEESPQPNNSDDFPPSDKAKFLYHVNKVTGIHHLCISLSVAPNIPAIAHKKGPPGFFCCNKIITCSWFIQGLTKLF